MLSQKLCGFHKNANNIVYKTKTTKTTTVHDTFRRSIKIKTKQQQQQKQQQL